METFDISRFICPRCGKALSYKKVESANHESLVCAESHAFSFDNGIPILLSEEDSLASHVKEAFSDLAQTYEQTVDRELRRYWGVSYDDFVQSVIETVVKSKPRNFLDIATGTGKIPRTLGNRDGIRMSGLDITIEALRVGRARLESAKVGTRVELVCASAMNIPYADESFDVVTCILASHHLDVPRFLSEARRVLAKNGTLIIADVIASDFFRKGLGKLVLPLLLLGYVLTHKKARAQAEKEAFETILNGPEWKERLTVAGFTGIKEEFIKPKRPYYPGGMIMSGIRA